MLVDNQWSGRIRSGEIASLIRCVDLFCGAGGLTHGLASVGINVGLGIDIDPSCKYPYTANNNVSFLLKSVKDTTSADISKFFDDTPLRMLAGCAPCQPFSYYSRAQSNSSDRRWHLLEQFSRLVRETTPHLVTMENVPLLQREDVFSSFHTELRQQGFDVIYRVVNCADYGVPQQRKRLILLASRLGPINLIAPETPEGYRITVKDAIGNLVPLKAGERCSSDSMHQACDLSPINLQRIQASKPGGSWRDWDEHLIAKCHRKKSGRTYSSVYGRMVWDKPSPTMTTQFYGFGNGRFGHPEQDRAISLREGAILQSFPVNYKFAPEDTSVCKRTVGRLIGNAVPVKLGAAIGKSIVSHVEKWLESKERIL